MGSSPEDKMRKSKKYKKKKRGKEKEKHKKRKRRSRSSSSSEDERKRMKRMKNNVAESSNLQLKLKTTSEEIIAGPSVPSTVGHTLAASKQRAPMTKEEWEKSQSVIRKVYDETGRCRLVKGDGEVLEEIVSKERHKDINRRATAAEGAYFQSRIQADLDSD